MCVCVLLSLCVCVVQHHVCVCVVVCVCVPQILTPVTLQKTLEEKVLTPLF